MGKNKRTNQAGLRHPNLIWLLLIEGAMAVSLFLIFSKDPIFPATLSADFFEHLQVAQGIAAGHYPSFSSVILYGDVWYYLALWVKIIPVAPIIAVRWGMAFLVSVSPLIVYQSVKVILDGRAAIWSSALYALSGFLWFGMVFNSGLYPNFWGLLSSLMLVAAAKWLTDGISAEKVGVFALIMVNALFSHHTTPFVLPPLLICLYLAMRKASPTLRRPYRMVLALLGIPFALGVAVMVETGYDIMGHIFDSTGNAPPPTFLSSLLILPTLSNMAAEISANWLGDVAALAVLALGAWFLLKTWELRKPEMWLFSLWFLLLLLAPVYTQAAWRDSFVALAPLTVMAGWSLSRLKPKPLLPGKAQTWLFMFLILTPSFGSWANLSAWSSIYAQPSTASQQQYDLQATQWASSHLSHYCEASNGSKCWMVSANDFNFLFLPYMGGPNVVYAPDYGVPFTDALQVQYFTSQHGVYIEVSKNGTASGAPCNPSRTFGLKMTANATSVEAGGTILFTLEAVKGLNTTVIVWDNGTQGIQVGLQNGFAQVSVDYVHPGVHALYLGIGSTLTYPMNITVGGGGSIPGAPKSVTVPVNYCQPWFSFNPDTMRGWVVVYRNEMTRIYRVNV